MFEQKGGITPSYRSHITSLITGLGAAGNTDFVEAVVGGSIDMLSLGRTDVKSQLELLRCSGTAFGEALLLLIAQPTLDGPGHVPCDV